MLYKEGHGFNKYFRPQDTNNDFYNRKVVTVYVYITFVYTRKTPQGTFLTAHKKQSNSVLVLP